MSGRSFAISHERASPAECYAIWKAGFEESTDTRAGKHPVGVLAFRAQSRSMQAAGLRALVQRKLQDGGFANGSLTAVVAGPRNGEAFHGLFRPTGVSPRKGSAPAGTGPATWGSSAAMSCTSSGGRKM